MAHCQYCAKEMTTGESCTVEALHLDGVRKRLGRAQRRCGDCGLRAGGFHHLGCDLQRCPTCRGQLITCGCVFDEDQDEDEFPTRLEIADAPVWEPLEAVARLARTSADLPSFHEGEFMYMAAVHGDHRGVAIHLYKHIDTRRYLNLDDDGNAYRYCGSDDGLDDDAFGGRYVRLRTLAEGIARLGLDELDNSIYRSFPPSEWPPADGRRMRLVQP